jgi:glycosyltransferase involved in cell wall biosynthesis
VRLAFLAGGSVVDRRAWSGTTYYVHRALAKRFNVSTIEMPRMKRALRGLRKVMRSTGIDPLRERLCSAVMSKHAARMLAQIDVDAVFVLSASHIAADLAGRFPVFHCSDATFAAMVGYHGEFKHLSRRTVTAGNELERKVIGNSTAVILASDWAAQSVRDDYHRTAGVHVVPFGANLDELPAADVWQRRDECSLVFIGVNWYEKGADVAVAATRLLNERGIKAVLHIVGCSPPPDYLAEPFVRLHGFLRKQHPDEYAQLTALVADADFVLVPTRFEALGIVFCEAAAHGTPAIARRTGGIPTVIDDGVTGALLPPDAGPAAYSERIAEIWSDHNRYVAMRRLAFAKSRRTLNWDAWGDGVETIIREALALRSTEPIAENVQPHGTPAAAAMTSRAGGPA